MISERLSLARAAWFPAVGGLAVLAGAGGIFREMAMFFRAPSSFEPAVWINEKREPELTSFIQDLCRTMGTRIPDYILLHGEAKFFVMQGKLTALNANPRGRVLTLGLPLLGCLTINELRAILSHELAHFTGQDTMYSAFVVRMHHSLQNACAHLWGTAEKLNGLIYLLAVVPLKLPIWTMSFYAYLFTLLGRRIDRGREFRADVLACRVCGQQSMSSGLRKAAAYGMVYGHALPKLLAEVAHSRAPGESALRIFRKNLNNVAPMAKEALKLELDRPEQKWDTHPALKTRIERFPAVEERYTDGVNALTLLKDLKRYETMIGQFYANEYRLYQQSQMRGIR